MIWTILTAISVIVGGVCGALSGYVTGSKLTAFGDANSQRDGRIIGSLFGAFAGIILAVIGNTSLGTIAGLIAALSAIPTIPVTAYLCKYTGLTMGTAGRIVGGVCVGLLAFSRAVAVELAKAGYGKFIEIGDRSAAALDAFTQRPPQITEASAQSGARHGDTFGDKGASSI